MEAAIAALRADMRSLWGSQPWSTAQMLGEQPPPMADSIEALEAQAADAREASAIDVSESWADDLARPLLFDDDVSLLGDEEEH